MTAVATRETDAEDFAQLLKDTAPGAGLAKLREPFPPEKIGKLPKPTISNEEWKKLDKGHCNVCGGWHATSKTMHLDFVGHADVTERLLDVDPNWNWEPLGLAPDGLPAMITNGAGAPIGLWIKLTVCGITRIGFGSVSAGAFDAEKQLIGDALRNAAMRFGVALDLWRKDAPPADENGSNHRATSSGAGASPSVSAPTPQKVKVLSREATGRVCPEDGGDLELVTWDNNHAAVCCTNWREKDGGCKHRELAESAGPIPEPIFDDTPVPFA
jgi:hypothetical protein